MCFQVLLLLRLLRRVRTIEGVLSLILYRLLRLRGKERSRTVGGVSDQPDPEQSEGIGDVSYAATGYSVERRHSGCLFVERLCLLTVT
jgi:hypothetical protein